MVTRIRRFHGPAALAFVFSAAWMLGCSAATEATEGEDIESAEGAVTATGTAAAGSSCLGAPVLRADKCKPGLACAIIGGAPRGTCLAPQAEAQSCNPSYGSLGCAPGLTCTLAGSGGFCKGSGLGACRLANAGLDCAAGRTCVESSLGSGAGSCQPVGVAGASCNADTLVNECAVGLSCVHRANGAGVCSTGVVGAPCDANSGAPYDPLITGCHEGLICYGQPGVASPFQWTCQAGVKLGDYCNYTSSRCDSGLTCHYWSTRDSYGQCVKTPKAKGASCNRFVTDDCGFHMRCIEDPTSWNGRFMCSSY